MVGENSSSSTRDEMLLEILASLSTEDIMVGARLVCRKWFDLIRTKKFIRKHIENASVGLLYADAKWGNFCYLYAREDGRIVNHSLLYNFTRRKTTWSCCNGLMVESEAYQGQIVYCVTNLFTHKVLRLPQCPHNLAYYRTCALGYDIASMNFKAVVTYLEEGQYKCAILTVGEDSSWRTVGTDHLFQLSDHMILSKAIITEGFVHWRRGSITQYVTLNLETEIITKTLLPDLKERIGFCFLPAGRYLSLFVPRGDLVWEFYEMIPGTGEWKKMPNICFEGQKNKIKRLGKQGRFSKQPGCNSSPNPKPYIKPLGWLKYPEVLALRVGWVSIITYNLLTSEVGDKKFAIDRSCSDLVRYFKYRLVWLGEDCFEEPNC